MKQLRQLESSDHEAVLQVYRLAVESCSAARYSDAQRQAWSRQARTGEGLRRSLQRGSGLVSVGPSGDIAAFCLREPRQRLSLLYCHPAHQRRGHARALLRAMEEQARQAGLRSLCTEASLLSRPLFEQEGWRRSWQEELLIHGVRFRRYRLHKPLAPILS